MATLKFFKIPIRKEGVIKFRYYYIGRGIDTVFKLSDMYDNKRKFDEEF